MRVFGGQSLFPRRSVTARLVSLRNDRVHASVRQLLRIVHSSRHGDHFRTGSVETPYEGSVGASKANAEDWHTLVDDDIDRAWHMIRTCGWPLSRHRDSEPGPDAIQRLLNAFDDMRRHTPGIEWRRELRM